MPPASEALGDRIVELLPRLRRFARALSRSVHDADDLVQIAIERALARAGQLRPDAALSSWMFGILRNAWIDECRARQRRARIFLPEALGEQVGNSAGDPLHDDTSVQQAMARLPEEQREVIALVLVEGFSYREAADIMSVPIGTVTSRLARGREALQQILSGSSGDAS